MSEKSWQSSLKEILPESYSRFTIVGMGNELRGDDAAGVEIVRRLELILSSHPDVLLLQAANVPENMIGRITRFQPDVVLFVDSVFMNAEPGSIQLIDLHNITEAAVSTHSLSIGLVTDYLKRELDCVIRLLGIQPFCLSLFSPLSDPVETSVDSVVRYLACQLNQSPLSRP